MVEPCSRDVPETHNSKCVVDKKVQICLVVFEAPWRNSNHCVLVKQKKLRQRNGASRNDKKDTRSCRVRRPL